MARKTLADIDRLTRAHAEVARLTEEVARLTEQLATARADFEALRSTTSAGPPARRRKKGRACAKDFGPVLGTWPSTWPPLQAPPAASDAPDHAPPHVAEDAPRGGLRGGTYEWDMVVSKIVAWASGGITVTLRVLDWDNDSPGPHHDRQITWDQARPDLVARFDLPGEDGERARNGYAAFRGALVSAYTACGWPEDQWPGAPDNPTPPFWLFFVHTCPDGQVVPVTLHAKVIVQPKRSRWPVIAEIRQILTDDGRPFQAPLPYCVPEALAHEHGWAIAEMKWLSDKAHVALLDRDSVAFPHGNFPTYKNL